MKTFTIKTFVLSLFVGLLISIDFAYAQSPENFSYQAVIRDASGELAVNSNIGIQISILELSETGNAVYVERHFPSTNNSGLVSLEIGTGTVVSGDFGTIDWGGNTHFIKMETDLNGGSNYDISNTSQLLSVPYAINANSVSEIEDGRIDVNHLSTVNAENGDILKFNGTEWERVPDNFELIDQNTLTTNKDVDIDGQLQNTAKTGEANLLPIAYGMIRNDEISTGTGNFSISKGSSFSGDYYEIDFDDHYFIYYNFIAQATVETKGSTRVTSSGGKMRVYTYDENGDSAYSDFYFIVYQP